MAENWSNLYECQGAKPVQGALPWAWTCAQLDFEAGWEPALEEN